MSQEILLLREKACRALDAARACLDRHDAETASNRAYYAAFYITTAYVRHLGQRPRSHKGLHVLWNQIADKGLPSDLNSFLTHAFHVRQRADYDALTVLEISATASLVEEAERFVRAVEALFP